MRAVLPAVSLLALLGCSGENRTSETPPPAETKCVPAVHRLCPVDEAPGDSSFSAFRRQMLDVVERKDAAALSSLMDPSIRTSFGDDGGAQAFVEKWQPQSSASPLWNELHEILTHGGSFRESEGKRTFWAPSVFSTWPDSIDAYQFAAVIRAQAPLHTSPADSAATVALLDWAIVELIFQPPSDSAWTHVRTMDGKEGWMAKSDVRSPLGYRAGFDRPSGAWRMSALVAGD